MCIVLFSTLLGACVTRHRASSVMWLQLLRHFRHWTKKVADFTAGRVPEADDGFLADCDLPPGAEAVRVALAVRKVFGEVGSVDPKFIRPTDRFPDELGVLPGWDSIDMLDVVFRLEKELNVKVWRNPVLPVERFTVRDFVHSLLTIVHAGGPAAT